MKSSLILLLTLFVSGLMADQSSKNVQPAAPVAPDAKTVPAVKAEVEAPAPVRVEVSAPVKIETTAAKTMPAKVTPPATSAKVEGPSSAKVEAPAVPAVPPQKEEKKADPEKKTAADEPRIKSGVRYKKSKAVPDLIITANYRSPAILAAIARKEKGVPCILLPTLGDTKGKIWFVPVRNSGILEIRKEDLGKFISYLAPKRILILGDELIVPERFRPLSLPDRPAMNIVAPNWNLNAMILGNLLEIKDMREQYVDAYYSSITEPVTKGLVPAAAAETIPASSADVPVQDGKK